MIRHQSIQGSFAKEPKKVGEPNYCCRPIVHTCVMIRHENISTRRATVKWIKHQHICHRDSKKLGSRSIVHTCVMVRHQNVSTRRAIMTWTKQQHISESHRDSKPPSGGTIGNNSDYPTSETPCTAQLHRNTLQHTTTQFTWATCWIHFKLHEPTFLDGYCIFYFFWGSEHPSPPRSYRHGQFLPELPAGSTSNSMSPQKLGSLIVGVIQECVRVCKFTRIEFRFTGIEGELQ